MTIDSNGEKGAAAETQEAELLGKRISELVIAYISCPQDSGRNYLGGIRDWAKKMLGVTVFSQRKLAFAGATKMG